MNIEEFLLQDEIKELIAAGDLETVYEKYYPPKYRGELSEYLLNRGINPLNYFTNSIPDHAFMCCHDLEILTIPDGITAIGADAFNGCDEVESVTIGDSVTSIGYYAFGNCGSLEEVITGENSRLTHIGVYAFVFCSALKRITIPSGVIEIGADAFNSCDDLEDIYYKGTKAQWRKIKKGEYWYVPELDETTPPTIHCIDGDIRLKQQF